MRQNKRFIIECNTKQDRRCERFYFIVWVFVHVSVSWSHRERMKCTIVYSWLTRIALISLFSIGKQYLQLIPVYIKTSHQHCTTLTYASNFIHTHSDGKYEKNNYIQNHLSTQKSLNEQMTVVFVERKEATWNQVFKKIDVHILINYCNKKHAQHCQFKATWFWWSSSIFFIQLELVSHGFLI